MAAPLRFALNPRALHITNHYLYLVFSNMCHRTRLWLAHSESPISLCWNGTVSLRTPFGLTFFFCSSILPSNAIHTSSNHPPLAHLISACFPTCRIDTGGVIKRVKQLFKGHPELTRGFAAFLPKEYKIDVQGVGLDDDEGEMEDMSGAAGGLTAAQVAAVQAQQAQMVQQAAAAAQAQQVQQQQQQQHAQQMAAAAAAAARGGGNNNANNANNAAPAGGAGGNGGGAGGGAGEAVGEEHARVYVKKIKNRFVNQPHIYKSFLDILHTFHREKHSIQEVYTQVAALFRDHPDLLGEFAHFLPDPNAQHHPAMVQAQQQIHAQQQQQQQQHLHGQYHDDHHGHHHGQHGNQHSNQGNSGGSKASAGGRTTSRTGRGASGNDMMGVSSSGANRGGSQVGGGGGSNARQGSAGGHHHAHHGGGGGQGGASAGVAGNGNALPGGPMAADGGSKDRSHGTFEELMHFFKLKQVLPQNDYEEMLKLLSMYNADVLSKTELYYMVRDLLRHQDMELLEWFRKFMQLEDLKDDEAHGYIADYDWSTSEKLGPSYRATPRHWEQWKCSGRSGNALCTEVLNDSWISVPTGTEEGSFKSSRKNQYEELLFKCEDDRFELDLLVEGNVSAIRQLEILLASFRTLSPSALATFQLNESDLHVLTVKAIRRVYGPRADEFIKMIMGKPSVAIPVVLSRLKAKDTEWNLARREWNVLWKQIFKKNYHKQLDHRSTVFKQEEKKMLTAKALFAELRRASAEGGSTTGISSSNGAINTTTINKPTSSVSTRSSTEKQNDAANAAASAAAAASASTSNEDVSRMDVDDGSKPSDAADGNGKENVGSSSASSAVGSPTLSFIISQPNLFADIKKLLMLTFAAQVPKVDVAKFGALWNSLICAFFHVDPTLKSVLGDTITEDITLDGESTEMAIDGPSDASAAAPSGADASSSASSTTAANTAASATEGVSTESIVKKENASGFESTNKPISTELASQPATHTMLFLGNDSFYLLFRYLQVLYDRMAEAWSFSEEFPPAHHTPIVEIDPKAPISETVPAALKVVQMDGAQVVATAKKESVEGSSNASASTSADANGSAMDQENGVASSAAASATDSSAAEKDTVLSSSSEGEAIIYEEKHGPESSLTRYHNFLKNAEALIAGRIEQQTFEEKCRHDFGISCFPLFTIDKILLLLAKQFHAVNSDEMSEKLAGLYQYEVSRNMLGGFTDAVYLSNCREVLSHEKHAYVFTFDANPEALILGVTEVDLGHPSFGLEHNEELSAYINKLATNEAVLAKKAQRQALLASAGSSSGMKVEDGGNGSSASNAAAASHSPFLRRNVESGDAAAAASGAVAGSSSMEGVADSSSSSAANALPQGASEDNLLIQNELGVKVAPGSFKLRFVGGTEDSLQRQGRNTEHALSQDKISLDALQQNASLPNPMVPQ